MRWSARVDIAQSRVDERRFLFSDLLGEAVAAQKGLDFVELSVDVVDFEHRLLNLGPVCLLNTAQHIELSAFAVHLQQVDSVKVVFSDDVRDSHESADHLLSPLSESPGQKPDHKAWQVLGVPHGCIAGVAPHSFFEFALGIRPHVWMGGRERWGVGVVHEAHFASFIGDPAAIHFGVCIRLQVCFSDSVNLRDGFEGKQPELTLAALVEAHTEQSDVGPHIEDHITWFDLDSVAQVPLHVVIEHFGFILMDAEHLSAIAQRCFGHGHGCLHRACVDSISCRWGILFAHFTLFAEGCLDGSDGDFRRFPMSTISLCIITRDAAPSLPRCIQSAQEMVDELIVLDTGMLNGAGEWAVRAGARLIPFAWTGDAADARTTLAQAATSDWILMLEADESLAPGAMDEIITVIQRGGIDCGYLVVKADQEASASLLERLPRLLRRTIDLRWDGGEPESVAGWIAMRARRVRAIDATILRDQQDDEQKIINDSHMNPADSSSSALVSPSNDEPSIREALAQAWDRYHDDDLAGTRAAIEGVWSRIDATDESALQAATLRIHVHLLDQDAAAALETIAQVRTWGLAHPNLSMLEGVAYEGVAAQALTALDRRTHLESARQAFESCLNYEQDVSAQDGLPGVTSWAAYTRLGSALMGLGRTTEAADAFDAALTVDPEHAEAALGKLEALLEDGQGEVIMNALMPFMEAGIADGWMLAAAACEQMGRIEDSLLFVARANELAQEDMVVAKHRLLRMQELISMAGVYVGRPVTGPGRWGALGAILSRDPLPGHAEVLPVHDAMVVRVVAHLVAAGWTDMIEALLEPRAEQIAPGISEAVVRTLQAHGAEVVDDQEPEPVFVGGAWDSGISGLQTMLDAHHRIQAGPEVKLVPILCSLRNEWWRDMGPDLEAAGIGETELDQAVRVFVHQLTGGATYTDRRVVESTPHSLLHMGMLARIFPRARFVHVVRDGRDVAASLVGRQWMDPATGENVWCCQSVGEAATYWAHMVSAIREQAEMLPGRYLEIRYEDLVSQPEFVMRHVMAFLGEAWDPSVLSVPVSREAVSEPLSEQDANTIRNFAGNELRTFGYLTFEEHPDEPHTLLGESSSVRYPNK